MISTKGRYALRIVLDLAGRDPDSWISLDTLAASQQISKKYLESVIRPLVRDGYIQGTRGKGGGYRLLRSADRIPVGDLLNSAEGGLCPVACLKDPDFVCARKESCLTRPLWKKFDQTIQEFFRGISVQDVLNGTF